MDKGPDAFRTISEVAAEIDVPQHVLRFWESRFAQIRPMKRGAARFYRPDDVDLLRGVRHLLYGEGYTIRGVQRILREQGAGFVQDVWRAGAEPPPPPQLEDDEEEENFAEVASREDTGPQLSGFPFGASREHSAAPAERREPQLAPPSLPAVAQRGTGAQNKQRLRAALDELVECQRLIEQVLTVSGS